MTARKKISKHPFPTQFQLHFASVWGQQVFIVGSCKELGLWNLANAFKMEWTIGNIWKLEIGLFEGNHQYKYFVSDGNTITWEKRNNRTVEEKGNPRVTYPLVNCIWDSVSQHEQIITVPVRSSPEIRLLKETQVQKTSELRSPNKITPSVPSTTPVKKVDVNKNFTLNSENFPKLQPPSIRQKIGTSTASKIKSVVESKRQNSPRSKVVAHNNKQKARKMERYQSYLLKEREKYLQKISERDLDIGSTGLNPKDVRTDIWTKRDKSTLRYKKLDIRKNKRQKHCKDPRDNTRKKEQYLQLQMALYF